jgi:hypothetical protein
MEEKLSSTCRTTHIDSVKSVNISDKMILPCSNYFPNAMELEISSYNSQYPKWDKLNHVVPLQQLTRMIFRNYDHNLKSITGLLNLTPNVHTLIIRAPLELRTREKYVVFEEDETFQLVSNANYIKFLVISTYLTLEEIKLFTDLCPRVEHLSICIRQNFLRRVLQYLLSKDNTKTRHLNSILIVGTSEIRNEIMESLIESENLQVDYIIGKYEDEHLCDIFPS